METRKVSMQKDTASCKPIANLVKLRKLAPERFIERHASGTLRKNMRVGLAWRAQYLHERAAYEYGYAFECLPATRVTTGRAQTEGDCKPLTEVGWHCERYLARMVFPEDKVEVCYIRVVYPDGSVKEGVGMVVAETSAAWVPDGHCVFAIIAELDRRTNEYLPAVNPF